MFTAPITWIVSGLATELTITFTDGFSQLAMAQGFSVGCSDPIQIREVNASPSAIDLKVGSTGSLTVFSPVETSYPIVSVNLLCNDSGASVQYSFNNSPLTTVAASLGDPGCSINFPSLENQNE